MRFAAAVLVLSLPMIVTAVLGVAIHDAVAAAIGSATAGACIGSAFTIWLAEKDEVAS